MSSTFGREIDNILFSNTSDKPAGDLAHIYQTLPKHCGKLLLSCTENFLRAGPNYHLFSVSIHEWIREKRLPNRPKTSKITGFQVIQGMGNILSIDSARNRNISTNSTALETLNNNNDENDHQIHLSKDKIHAAGLFHSLDQLPLEQNISSIDPLQRERPKIALEKAYESYQEEEERTRELASNFQRTEHYSWRMTLQNL